MFRAFSYLFEKGGNGTYNTVCLQLNTEEFKFFGTIKLTFRSFESGGFTFKKVQKL